MAALIVRNLTSTAIELKLVERVERPSSPPSSGGLASITRNITTFLASLTGPAPPTTSQLEDNAQSFQQHDVSIPIGAFSTYKTEIKSVPSSSDEILRLTFENDSERYRIDLPTPYERSSILSSLTLNPKFQYTAVFLPQSSHLSLYSSVNLNSWMHDLKDETPVSALSIPGTHNSPTCHRALPSVRCQAASPREQLENGVRFFDIRLQIENPEDPQKDGLILVHSVFPISLTGTKYFRDLVNEVHSFLDQNPTETLIMSVKREGTGNGSDAQLSKVLRDHYAGDINRWFTAPRLPTLGEARKKIILMRRFGLEDSLKKEWDGQGWCINAETWADNTAHAVSPSGELCVQDFYEVLVTENIEKKITYAKEQLKRAAECVCPLSGAARIQGQRVQPLYINFLSASNFWKVGCWPEKIATKLNPAIVDYLCRNHNEPDTGKNIGDGSTGIVVCDWVGNNGNWDLVRCIVGMNAKLELREKPSP